MTAMTVRLPRCIAGGWRNWRKLKPRERAGILTGCAPAAAGLYFLAAGPGLVLRIMGVALIAQQAAITFWILASSTWRRGFQAVCNQPRPENWRQN